MGPVRVVIDAFPFDRPALVVEQPEELLLGEAIPGLFSAWRDPSPVEAVHFSAEYVPQTFGPPTGVFESDRVRVEWQTINHRQSFYHRNLDADELSFQVCGERTLLTELGTVELVTGDWSLTPTGVAHDNWGREEIHLLFYIPSGVEECQAPAKASEFRIPPFEGWVAADQNEVFGEGLGAPGGVLGAFPMDETLLLRAAQGQTRRVGVLRVDGAMGTTWLYKTPEIWIGETHLEGDQGRTYQRHLNCDEIQYQISGRRSLVTQRGVLQLEPGDFVRVPRGMAFSSIAVERSEHITLVSAPPLPQVATATAKGERLSVEELTELRRPLL